MTVADTANRQGTSLAVAAKRLRCPVALFRNFAPCSVCLEETVMKTQPPRRRGAAALTLALMLSCVATVGSGLAGVRDARAEEPAAPSGAAASHDGTWEQAKRDSQNAWEQASEASGKAWEAARDQSVKLWGQVTDKETWHQAQESSNQLWLKAKQESQDAWDAAAEHSQQAWESTKEFSQREWERASSAVSGKPGAASANPPNQ
jgi:hypothetical protein